MEQEYRHAIALMRYSAIAPLIPGLPGGTTAADPESWTMT